ncbi:TRAP transporter small permease [Chloroflexota bacterium]
MQQEKNQKRVASFFRNLTIVSRVCLFALVLLMTFDVIVGQFWGRLVWQHEIYQWLLLASIFFAVPFVTFEKGHPKIDLLVKRFSLSTQAYLIAFSCVISLIACGVLIYWGVVGAILNWQQNIVTEHLMLPQAPIQLLIPLGIFMMCIVLIIQFIAAVKEARNQKGAG